MTEDELQGNLSALKTNHRIAQAGRWKLNLTANVVISLVVILLTFQQIFAVESRIVKVGSDEHFPVLFQDKNGVAQGLYVDLLTEIGNKENIRFEYVFGTWDNTLNLIKSGKIGLLPGVGYTEERSQYMDYCKIPLLTVWGELYVLQSSEIKSLLDISGKKIGVIKSDINAKNFLELTKKFHIKCDFVELAGYEDVFKAVKTKAVDAGVVGVTFGASKQGEYGLRSTGVVFNPYDLYITTTKGENQDLILILDKYLSEWKNQDISALSNAKQKWIYGSVGTVAVVPDWMINVFILLGFMIVVAAAFIMLLKLQVKRTTKALRESEGKYRELVENANSIILRVDNTGTITFFNEYASHFLGFSKDEIIGQKAVGTIISSTDSTGKDLAQMVLDLTVHPEQYKNNENENMRKDGTRVWVAWTNKPILNDQGRCVELLCIGNDITERKQAEEALRESEKRYRLIFNNSPLGVMHFDANGIIVDFNDNFAQIMGGAREKIIGFNMLTKLRDQAMLTAVKDALDGRLGHYEGDYVSITAGKTTRMRAIYQRITTADGKFLGAVGLFEDIGERKQAEEEKAALEGQLQQAQKMESVGRLAGGVAHDFNNMLGVIIGHAEIAMDKAATGRPLVTDLEEIRNAAQRSADLTRQLLAFARKQVASPKVLDMNEAVEGMLKMLQRLIGEDVNLAWQPGVNLWPVKVDPSQIDQILANLCVNARDAIVGVGKLTIETGNISFDEEYCANHAGFVPGEFALLVVSDDGCGMDKETIAKIFEPFFTTKVLGKGTGLGLATVYGIVKQNNGFINVYSEPGQGTTFKIYLPRQVGKKTGQLRKEVTPAPVLRGQETILLVEDEPTLLELSKLLLETQGYRVLPAGTPGEALRLAEEFTGKIHLLMTDVVMPEMNGRELAQKMLALYPHLQCLFTSGYTANVIAHHGVLDENVHFIQKPFSRKDLAIKVREALE